jgi:rhodanese-related sulfurtransferase
MLERINAGDDSIILIDSRTPDWVARGMIPGAINVPWTMLNVSRSDPLTIADLLETQFGAMQTDGFWDFSQAKTLILYCNGLWCGQSPTNIKTLLRLGYPAHKLKWYRGGMQAWQTVGLTTTMP